MPQSAIPIHNSVDGQHQDIRSGGVPNQIEFGAITAQITMRMQMWRRKKCQSARPHALLAVPTRRLNEQVLVSLQQRTDPNLHPLLQVREVKKEMGHRYQ